jgi:hypothetical protein
VPLARRFLSGAVIAPEWPRYTQALLIVKEFAFVD